MHYRVRYRLSFPPFAVVSACLAALIATTLGPLGPFLERSAAAFLPDMVVAVSVIVPLAFLLWYLFSYADVRRQVLTVRSTFSVMRVDLGTLVAAEVFAKPPSSLSALRSGFGAKDLDVMVRFEDEVGRQVFLPLNTWRDENLLMARVLRATVDRKVRIEGDPELVRRFSGLLVTYKSWDLQRAA